jgi:uncharacterized protein YecE (DUF72 family)
LERFFQEFSNKANWATELRHEGWFKDQKIFNRVCELFETHKVSLVIHDAIGRRDALHMRLTGPTAFIRFSATNTPSDIIRLESWIERISKWKSEGLNELCFFFHQQYPGKIYTLAAHFIKELNESLGLTIKIPTAVQEINGK